MNRPCIIIPVYNHQGAVLETLQSLAYLGLPCFAINDGSTDGSGKVLDTFAHQNSWVTAIHLEKNAGKGEAVLMGLTIAKEKQYTHALLVDADGQHYAPDAVRFLEASKESPSATILGAPQFDCAAPKARKYGREISNVLAWIQTLSIGPRDVLCGFRLLPLNDQCSKVYNSVLGRRMDFDPEIVVKLSWAGVQFINIPTPVSYPRDGISHFAYIADNMRIAKTHCRLLMGMIIRSPKLLLRKIFTAQMP